MSASPPPLGRAAVARELQRLRDVRLVVVERQPFWGHLLLHMRLTPAPDLDALAATDCLRHIWFNPRYTRHLSPPRLAFVLLHELGHVLLASLPRQRGRDPYLWNCATDYAINRVIYQLALRSDPRGSVQLADGRYPDIGEVAVLLDKRFDGMTAEAIYDHLCAERAAGPGGGAGGTVQITLPADVAGGAARVVQVDGHHGGGLDVHLPPAGGGDDDAPDRDAPDRDAPAHDAPAHDALADEALREQLRERIAAALAAWRAADRRGELPEPLLRHLPASGRGVLPWRRVLRRYLGAAAQRSEYALHRPNRRLLLEDLLVPTRVAAGPSRLVVAVDTSGSMAVETLAAVLAELRALGAVADGLTVLLADAKVHAVVEARALRALLKRGALPGGGGTDHRPVFAWIAAQPEPPDLFIGITDLYSRFPPEKPTYPLLWIAPAKHGAAPWGRVLVLPEAGARARRAAAPPRPPVRRFSARST